MQNLLKNEWKIKIQDAYNKDTDSKLGTYFKVNPTLTSNIDSELYMFELYRILLTRYRTGSHNLLIETGRYCNPRVPREQRLCVCKQGVQTVHHLMKCTLLSDLRKNVSFPFDNISNFFKWNGYVNYLLQTSKILKIEV